MLLVFILFFFIILIITTELRLCIDVKNNKFDEFLKIYIFGFFCVGKVNLRKLKSCQVFLFWSQHNEIRNQLQEKN